MDFLGFLSVTKTLKGWPKEKIMSKILSERACPQLLQRKFLRVLTLPESSCGSD